MATQKQIYSAIKFLISKDSDYVVGQNSENMVGFLLGNIVIIYE